MTGAWTMLRRDRIEIHVPKTISLRSTMIERLWMPCKHFITVLKSTGPLARLADSKRPWD